MLYKCYLLSLVFFGYSKHTNLELLKWQYTTYDNTSLCKITNKAYYGCTTCWLYCNWTIMQINPKMGTQWRKGSNSSPICCWRVSDIFMVVSLTQRAAIPLLSPPKKEKKKKTYKQKTNTSPKQNKCSVINYNALPWLIMCKSDHMYKRMHACTHVHTHTHTHIHTHRLAEKNNKNTQTSDKLTDNTVSDTHNTISKALLANWPPWQWPVAHHSRQFAWQAATAWVHRSKPPGCPCRPHCGQKWGLRTRTPSGSYFRRTAWHSNPAHRKKKKKQPHWIFFFFWMLNPTLA